MASPYRSALRVCVLSMSFAVAAVAGVSGRQVTVYTGATVIDGVGDEPLRNATVVVVDGRIRHVGSGEVAVPADAARVDLSGRFVIPGLVDAHVHINGLDAARRALRSGVTTARSMGAAFYADVGLRELHARSPVDAPQVVAAGYHVRPSPAEGFFLDHPDMSDLMGGAVRGEEALRRMARALISSGVDVIKVNATERAGLPETDPRQPFYGERELAALVSEAGVAGVPVAAHAHGDGGGRAAVLAGVRSIEHGTYLSEETLELMAERGTFLAPTIAVVVDLTQPGGDYDSPVLQVRGRHMLPRIRETAANAHRMGVKVVAATDTGYGPNSVLRISHELMELVGIGMTPLEAIRAGTVVGAELLGVDDRTGSLVAGKDADFVVLERNPLEDIGAVQDVLMVVSDGRVVVERGG